MRLTLRTMLAYMDDILEPADAQAIAKKIEESEFATNLMHRIRDVSRRLRLAAPKVDGRGIGLDPNTVAEYLDNTLSSERVTDFEKVCLESDVHLAEVASAHQILALVLGEPAEIEPALRERMYHIQDVRAANVETLAPASITPAAATEVDDDKQPRKKPEVPDYLREPPARRRGRPILVAAVLLALLGGGLFAAGQLGYLSGPQNEQLAQNQVEPQPGAAGNSDQANSANQGTGANLAETGQAASTTEAAPNVAATNVAAPTAATAPAAGQPGASPSPSTPSAPMPVAVQPNAQTPAPAVAPAPTSVPAPGTIAPSPSPTATVGGPNMTNPSAALPPQVPADNPSELPMLPGQPAPAARPNVLVPGGTLDVAGPVQNPAPASGTQPVNQPVSPVSPAPVAPATSAAVPAANMVAGTSAGGRPAVPGPAAAPGVPPSSASIPPSAPAAPAEGVGRLISEREVLLRFTSKDQSWERLPTRATVFPNDQLVALPTYRPNLSLTAGISVQFRGGAKVELLPPDSRGIPGIHLIDGRLILMTLGKADAQLRFVAGSHQALVTFHNPDSTLAIDGHRLHAPGTNPEKEPGIFALDIYATAGEVHWVENASSVAEVLQAPAHKGWGDERPGPADAADVFPDWIKKPAELSQIERRGSESVEQALQPDRSITLTLKELALHQRSEVSSLATQCLADIGDFEPAVAALNDSTQRLAWGADYQVLCDAIASGPATAGKVRAAFEHHRGPKGTDLYRMLWSYSPEQLQAGADLQLIKYLDDPELDFRVLSFYTLNHLTGATHLYRPDATAVNRARAVRTWRQRLESGQLFSKTPESKKPAE